jgi:hypothetical protein
MAAIVRVISETGLAGCWRTRRACREWVTEPGGASGYVTHKGFVASYR